MSVGRPIKYNLRRDGWQTCADYARRVIQFNKGLFRVYVADDGGLRVWPACERRNTPRPDRELVGTYNKRARIEEIEDDMRARLHELQEIAA
jgi:hypothetical protein